MKNTTITFRIKESEKEQLELVAAKRDIPVSQIIREAIREVIQKEND